MTTILSADPQVTYSTKHVRVNQAPDQPNRRVQPLHRLRDEIYHRRLAALLLARPLHVATLADKIFHPQEDARRNTGAQRQQSPQRAPKDLANEYNGEEYGGAEHVGARLDGRVHGLIAHRRRRVEEHVGLFAVDGQVARGAGLDGVGRCCDILRTSILFARLVWVGLDSRFLAQVGIGNKELLIFFSGKSQLRFHTVIARAFDIHGCALLT